MTTKYKCHLAPGVTSPQPKYSSYKVSGPLALQLKKYVVFELFRDCRIQVLRDLISSQHSAKFYILH